MKRLIGLVAAMLLATPAAAQGVVPDSGALATECRIRIVTAPAAWLIDSYDPFAGHLAEGTYSVTFSNDGGSECAFVPTFELSQPPFGLSRGTGRPVGYAILDLNDTRDVTPRVGRSMRRATTREIVLRANESKSILYKLVAEPGDAREAGTFTQDLTIEAQDKNFRSLGGAPLVVGLTILPSARIGLAGAYRYNDGQAIVDLGNLRPGLAPVPLQLRVSSTSGYDISMSSANSGRLRLGASEWSIPYHMAIGNDRVNLSGPLTISGPTANGFRRDSLPIRFIIGDISDKRAGSYSDTVSISVTAR